MDLLVIKKDRSIAITNQIGDIFRGHNILEYKSPDDGITIRDVHPYALFDRIKSSGGTVEQKYPGVYYVSGIFNTPSQICKQL